MIGTEVQIESNGLWRGRRIRLQPVDLCPGRRIGLQSGCRRAGPREEDTVRLTSTTGIWTLTVWSAMRPGSCQPCVFRRDRSARLPFDNGPVIGGRASAASAQTKKVAPLEGRARPLMQALLSAGGNNSERGRRRESALPLPRSIYEPAGSASTGGPVCEPCRKCMAGQR